jgi:hypothetical protein
MELYTTTFNSDQKQSSASMYWKKKQLRKISGMLNRNPVCQCLLLLKDFNLSSCKTLIRKRLDGIDDAHEFFTRFEELSNDYTVYKTKVNKQPSATLTFHLPPLSVSMVGSDVDDQIQVSINETPTKTTKTFKFPNQATMLALRYFFRDSWSTLKNPPVEWELEELPPLLVEWCKHVIEFGSYTTNYSAFVNSELLLDNIGIIE